ncbi:electron transport complex subunit RsxB [Halomonas sp. BC04]|uniref:electron transport complex subunit RsxB n=1 Tax=Halomonas sp. BC04 TaxID=1403540 RepID=UPI0003ED74E6|nr:electron transport complex subunit RsxB [Halomonas sp. BC04]EWG99838.1 electron transporter RnfB [Halomonas sp. BC04]
MTGLHVLIDTIDDALPQTQCGKCGHPGCRPYAEAIAAGEAINRCPPGGDATVARLAELTGREPTPLEEPPQPPLVAWIREAECIGCTKCIQACPVDAILGAAKRMHTVIATECTGCELCVAPCPVDCIDLLPHPDWLAADSEPARQDYLDSRARKGRQRFAARNRRLARQADEKRQQRARRQASLRPTPTPEAATEVGASPMSSSALRASRISLMAGLKRLERKEQRDDLTGEERAELERQQAGLQARVTELDRQLASAAADSADSPAGGNQRRMAVKAAEQSLRKARQQLAHAQRQGSSNGIASAEQQLQRAQEMLDDARTSD